MSIRVGKLEEECFCVFIHGKLLWSPFIPLNFVIHAYSFRAESACLESCTPASPPGRFLLTLFFLTLVRLKKGTFQLVERKTRLRNTLIREKSIKFYFVIGNSLHFLPFILLKAKETDFSRVTHCSQTTVKDPNIPTLCLRPQLITSNFPLCIVTNGVANLRT